MSDIDQRIDYQAELDVLDGSGAVVPVEQFYVYETLFGGWRGYISIQATDSSVSVERIFDHVTVYGILPGFSVALGLWCKAVLKSGNEGGTTVPGGAKRAGRRGRKGGDAGDPIAIPLRTWPSVVTGITSGIGESGNAVCQVAFADPITYLGQNKIFGVFRDSDPAHVVGGAISLALNGDGQPSQVPPMLGLPPVRIDQVLRKSLRKIPYVIATGETLPMWLRQFLGRLGVRMDIAGRADGAVIVTLRDNAPGSDAIAMTLNDGEPDAENLVLDTQAQHAFKAVRDTVLDNPLKGTAERMEGRGPVESLVTAAETGVDEARFRADFGADRSDLELSLIKAVTGQPGFHPGRRLGLLNRSISGADQWQVGHVEHGFRRGRYLNSVRLMKDGVAWRPPVPANRGPVTLSGWVDDGESDPGEPVARDYLGRIPVRFAFQCEPEDEEAPADAAESGADASAAPTVGLPAAPTVALSVVDPMAGGVHGFVPGHRQADLCRIAVHHPLHAEIHGFAYDDGRRIGERTSDSSMGMIVGNRPEGWSGVLFRPKDELAKETQDGAATAEGDTD